MGEFASETDQLRQSLIDLQRRPQGQGLQLTMDLCQALEPN